MKNIFWMFFFCFITTASIKADPRILNYDNYGDYLYFAQNEKLSIYNLRDLSHIHLAGEYVTGNSILTVQVVGNRLYLNVKTDGLLILSLLDPEHPVQIGLYPSSYYTLVKDSIAFQQTSTGLTLINVNTLPTPTIITSYSLNLSSFDVRDSILCISSKTTSDVMIYNIHDIYNPELKSTIKSSAYSCGPVYMNGKFLIITERFFGYHYSSEGAGAYNISDPSNPFYETSLLSTGGYASGSADQFDVYKNKFFYGWQGASYTGGWNYGSLKGTDLNNHNVIVSIGMGTEYGTVKIDSVHSYVLLYYNSGKLDIYSINLTDGSLLLQIANITDIKENTNFNNISFSLEQNYPNPFNPTTEIRYSISTNSFVRLKVYDLLGKEVETLVNEEKSPGNYTISYNAKALASGIYFYKLDAGKYSSIKKMIFIK